MAISPERHPEPGVPKGLSRRAVIERSAAGVGIALSGSFTGLFGSEALAHRGPRPRPLGYGPLVDDPAGLLSLPEGFSYSIVAQSGVTTLESGEPTPSDPDGTASFPRRHGGSVLIANHEVGGVEPFPVPRIEGFVYDPVAGGGTTTIEVDRHGRRIREYVSLAGTHNNCAGGTSPWGTWLTCEEAESLTGQTKPHGYVFEVDPYDQDANRDPKPIKALGRYAHEALVVDPHRGTIYLTEDAGTPNGLLYRWTPPDDALPLGKGVLRELADDAGELEAHEGDHAPRPSRPRSLRRHPARHDLRRRVGRRPGPRRRDRVDAQAVHRRPDHPQPQAGGHVVGRRRGLLRLLVRPLRRTAAPRSTTARSGSSTRTRTRSSSSCTSSTRRGDQDDDEDGPDNITVSAYGGLIIAEDGEGKQHLVGSSERGETFFFARNDDPEDSEFTGPNFSPDRKILFANVQVPGYVFAIQGPFRKQRR